MLRKFLRFHNLTDSKGKTIYYWTTLSAQYKRVCPSEEFKTNPTLTLHKIINNIAKMLKRGESVVLDDTSQVLESLLKVNLCSI